MTDYSTNTEQQAILQPEIVRNAKSPLAMLQSAKADLRTAIDRLQDEDKATMSVKDLEMAYAEATDAADLVYELLADAKAKVKDEQTAAEMERYTREEDRQPTLATPDDTDTNVVQMTPPQETADAPQDPEAQA